MPRHLRIEAINEYVPTAAKRITAKASRLESEPDGGTGPRQVAEKPLIPAVDPPSECAGSRAAAHFCPMAQGHLDFRTGALGVLHDRSRRGDED